MTSGQNIVSATIAAIVAASCTTGGDTIERGNGALGIARFEVQESARQTTVFGLDIRGAEVARVELVHGRFALSDLYKEDYPGLSEVDGRKLDVTMRGDRRLVWETAGYEPVFDMPAHPDGQGDLAVLLQDPHVKAVLDRWQIGFDSGPFRLDEESAYGGGTLAGTSPALCYSIGPQNYQCGTARDGLVINQCGGTTAAYDARRITRTTAGGFAYDEYAIAQCCPSGSGGQSEDWFAIKSCPTTGSASSAVATSCGTASANAACKGCASYPTPSYRCRLTSYITGTDYSYATSAEAAACGQQYNSLSCANQIPTNSTCASACTCTYDAFGGFEYWICW